MILAHGLNKDEFYGPFCSSVLSVTGETLSANDLNNFFPPPLFIYYTSSLRRFKSIARAFGVFDKRKIMFKLYIFSYFIFWFTRDRFEPFELLRFSMVGHRTNEPELYFYFLSRSCSLLCVCACACACAPSDVRCGCGDTYHNRHCGPNFRFDIKVSFLFWEISSLLFFFLLLLLPSSSFPVYYTISYPSSSTSACR